MTSWPPNPGQEHRYSNTDTHNRVSDNEQASTSTSTVATPTALYYRQQHAATTHYTPGEYQGQRYNLQAAIGQEYSYQWYGNSAISNPTTQETPAHTTRRDGDDAQSRSINNDDNQHNYDTSGPGNLAFESRLEDSSTNDSMHQRSPNVGLLSNIQRQQGADASYQTASQAPTTSNLSQNIYNREKSHLESTHITSAAAAAHQRQQSDATQSSTPYSTPQAASHTSSTISISSNYPKDTSNAVAFQEAASSRSVPNLAYSSAYNKTTSAMARRNQNSRPSLLYGKKQIETSDTSARQPDRAQGSSPVFRMPPQSQPQSQNTVSVQNHNNFVSNANQTQRAVNGATRAYQDNLQRKQYSSPQTYPLQPSRTRTPSRLNGQQQVQKQMDIQADGPPHILSPPRPLTVNPNQVYDRFHEYQRQAQVVEQEHARLTALRAVEEAAEAEKVAETAERERLNLIAGTSVGSKLVANDPSPQRSSASPTAFIHPAAEESNSLAHEISHPSNIPAAHKEHPDPGNVSKTMSKDSMVSNAMEKEMRAMVEKMREFQSRDPTLFSQVWQSVKRHQASSPASSPASGVSAKPSASVDPASDIELPSFSFSNIQTSSVSSETNIPEAVSEAKKSKEKQRPHYSRSKAAIAQRAAEKQKLKNDHAQKGHSQIQQRAVGGAPEISTKTQNPTLSTQTGPPQQPTSCEVPRMPHVSQRQIDISQPPTTTNSSHIHLGTTLHSSQLPIQEVTKRPPAETSRLDGTPKQYTPAHFIKEITHVDQFPPAVAQKNATAHADSSTKRSTIVQTGPEPKSITSAGNRPGLVWPQDKKGVLASTTVDFIKSFPENSAIQLVPQQIRYMLNQNPNYVNLCEMIEVLGFKIDRAKLARALLAAVPDVGGSQAQQQRVAHPGPKFTPTPTDQSSQIQAVIVGQSQTIPANAMSSQSTSTASQALNIASGTPILTSATFGKAHIPSNTTHITPSRPGPQASHTVTNGTAISVASLVNKRPPSHGQDKTQQVVASLETASADSSSRASERELDSTIDQNLNSGKTHKETLIRPVDQTKKDNRLLASRQSHISSASIPENLQASQITTPVTTMTTTQLSTDHEHMKAPTTPSTEDRLGNSVQSQKLSPFSSSTLIKLAQAISNLNGPTDNSANTSNQSVTRPPDTSVSVQTKKHDGEAASAILAKPPAMSNRTQYKSPYTAQEHTSSPDTNPKALEFLSRSVSHRKNHSSQDRNRSATVAQTAPTEILPPNRHANSHHDVAKGQDGGLTTNTPLKVDGNFHKRYSQPMSQSPSSGGIHVQGIQKSSGIQKVPATTPAPVARIITPAPEEPQVPMTKEQAARKRTFAEIMSLTSSRRSPSVEEIYPPGKTRRIEMPDITGRSLSGEHHVQNPQSLHATPTPTPSFVDRNIAGEEIQTGPDTHNSVFGFWSSLQHQNSYNSPPVFFTVAPNPYKDFEHIVQPLQKDDALPRERYNPQTIARDILIATSRHPYQRGLNTHLEILKTSFTKVDDNSDLTTFRWDIVDPSSDINITEIMDLDDASDIDQVEASPRPLIGASSTPAVPTSPFQRARDSSKLPSEATILPPNATPMIAVVIDNSNRGTFSEYPAFNGDKEDGLVSALSIHTMPKRIGRPPKHALSTNTATLAPRPRGRPPRLAPDQIGEVRVEAIVPKKRGRPFGSTTKNNAQSSKTSEPHFSPFKCGWRGCPAEPQNLETLRLHVTLVHDATTTCQWLECGALEELKVPETGKVYLQIRDKIFNDPETLRKHIEDVHISKYAWHMGDGPKSTTGESNTNTSYLNDAHGNEVTPSVEGQQFLRRTRAEILAGVSPATNIVLPAKRNQRSNKDASSRSFGNLRRELDIRDPEFRFDVKKHTYFPKSAQQYQESMGIWVVKPGYRWLYDNGDYSEDISESLRKADAAFEEREMERAATGMEMSPIPMLEDNPSNLDTLLQHVWYHP